MNRLTKQLFTGPPGRLKLSGLAVAAATLSMAALPAHTFAVEAGMMKIIRKEGGINPSPVLTSITAGTNKNLTLQWQSFGKQVTNAPSVVYKVVKCPALNGTNSTWSTLGTVTNANSLTAPLDGDIGFLTVQQDPAPAYAGSDRCGLCHIDTHDAWMTTDHAGAFQTLKNIHMEKNASCLPCHTVGFGTPNGFVDEATTPNLAGVQCENCHGPAGSHATKPLDKSKLPVRTFSAELCGGCHTDIHHPNYEEFATSAHGTSVIPEEEFADPATGPARMLTCGACHSAASRVTMLNLRESYPDPVDFGANVTTNDMPSTIEVSSTPITCVACHDPHLKTANDPQLRFPRASKVPYSYSTATNFAANFNPDVQTCAQCHNMRGATWTGTGRPPHHSPQYNILIGQGGFEAGVTNVPQSAHMDIQDQCIQCHVHPGTPDKITAETPALMGHTFAPTMQACAPCHDEIGAGVIKEAVQINTKQQITEIKALLDQWATTKAPDALRQKYGNLAWEFGTIGQLSTTNLLTQTGPNSTDQKSVPDGIKQARYNLYLVEHDHSYGIHNGNYTRFLLKVARDQVNAALQAQ